MSTNISFRLTCCLLIKSLMYENMKKCTLHKWFICSACLIYTESVDILNFVKGCKDVMIMLLKIVKSSPPTLQKHVWKGGGGGGVIGVYMKLKKSHLYRDTSLLLYAMLRQVQCRVYFVLFHDCNTTTPLRISI